MESKNRISVAVAVAQKQGFFEANHRHFVAAVVDLVIVTALITVV